MKKKASYVPSKSTSEKADSILGEIRRKQAVEDLVRSNKKMGLKPLNVSTSEATTTTQTPLSINKGSLRETLLLLLIHVKNI